MLSISVIIPALNEAERIGSLLDALQAQDYAGSVEVVVVDGGSGDATREIVRRFPEVKLLASDEPGTSRQRNQGASAATGDLLVFLDADNLPRREFLSSVARAYTLHPFAVACPWFVPDSRHPGIRLFYFVFNCLFWLSQWRFHTGAGVCIITPPDIFLQAGEFDETLHLGEDVHYIRRAARRGRHRHLCIPLRTSARRFEAEGVWSLARFYLRISPHLLCGSFDALRHIPYQPLSRRVR